MPCPTTHLEVLDAVVTKLRYELPELNASTCFVSMEPEPSVWRNNNSFITVAPMGGNFDASSFNGMGRAGVIEETGVIVTYWANIKLDSSERDIYAMADADRGVLVWKEKIIDALAGRELFNLNGQSLLTSLVQPATSQHPQAGSSDKHSGISLAFLTPFCWRLSPE